MSQTDISTLCASFDARDWESAPADAGPVRFAVVGLGWWTRDHAIPAIEASRFCTTTVAASSSAEKAMDVVEEHDQIEVGITYDAFHEGVHEERYDAVYICTPNAVHLPFVTSALERGTPVLCEKPMESTLERSEQFVDVAESTGTMAMIAYRMHTEPAVRCARHLVRAGAIGTPVHAHGDMSQSILGWGPDQWRLDPDLVGPGASVVDLGIYSINTLRFVLDADPRAVQSMQHSRHESFATVPDEVAAFTVAFDTDLYATCTASQNAAKTSHLRVVGTEGHLVIEPAFHMESSLSVTVGDQSMSVATESVDQMEVEFDYFADRLLTDRPPEPDPHHGLVDVKTIDAIYEAAETDRTVRITDL